MVQVHITEIIYLHITEGHKPIPETDAGTSHTQKEIK